MSILLQWGLRRAPVLLREVVRAIDARVLVACMHIPYICFDAWLAYGAKKSFVFLTDSSLCCLFLCSADESELLADVPLLGISE